MSMAGTILSQEHRKTSPSKAWALAMASTEAAIRSRWGRIYCIPMSWAMPSQGAGTVNSAGVPPAAHTPSFT